MRAVYPMGRAGARQAQGQAGLCAAITPVLWRAKTRQTPRGPARIETIEHLEEQIAHLTRTVDDLSDIVARQETEIALLTRRVHMLMQREGEREAAASGGVMIADERPPHY